jgi:hypothetical protein
MLQKNPNTNTCPSWTPEEIAELRNSLLTGDVAEVDAEMFGRRFSRIIARGRTPSKMSTVKKQTSSGAKVLLFRAFPGKVDTGFPIGNATNIESRALSGHDPCNFRVNLIGKRSKRD